MGDILLIWTILAYGVAAVIITYNHLRGFTKPSVVGWWIVASGCVVHGWVVLQHVKQDQGILVNFTTSLNLSSLAMGLIYLVIWRLRRQITRTAGLLLLPLMVFSLGASQLLPADGSKLQALTDPLLIAHLALSLLSYGLFSIAAILALMDAFQEHALRTKRFGKLFNLLPPLDALEETLFLMVRMGFVLLTIAITTGSLYSYYISGIFFTLTHKVVFTWATWLVFGTLIVGNHLWGWRGTKASKFTISGYIFLALAFLGVKFVSDILL
ncbi:MAG: cytochrome c biogenesis protein CcsA [Magnetococcales bacterium]|nr:cytochrome c biogenesis protein CcsA [Magnetococcales bacterium]